MDALGMTLVETESCSSMKEKNPRSLVNCLMLMLELAPDCGIASHLVLSQKQIILSRGLVKTFFLLLGSERTLHNSEKTDC